MDTLDIDTNDPTPLLSPNEAAIIPKITGKLTFYANPVDPHLKLPTHRIATRQHKPTKRVLADAYHLLDYAATYPDASITFYPSDMRLICFGDESYLTESHAKSRVSGYEYLGWNGDPLQPRINGPINVISCVCPRTAASVMEAGYAQLFTNGQRIINTRETLSFLGYPQGPNPLLGDNETSLNVATGKQTMKRTRSMWMKYHWVHDAIKHGDVEVIWVPGDKNLADYPSKIHPPFQYPRVRDTYTSPHNPYPGTHQAARTTPKGCVSTQGTTGSRSTTNVKLSSTLPGSRTKGPLTRAITVADRTRMY